MPEVWIAGLLLVGLTAVQLLGVPWTLSVMGGVAGFLVLGWHYLRQRGSSETRDLSSLRVGAQVVEAEDEPSTEVSSRRITIRVPVFEWTVQLDWLWNGIEIYTVDGKECLRLRSFALYGNRRIPLPDGRVLELRLLPPTVKAEVWVDGQMLHEDVLSGVIRKLVLDGVRLGFVVAIPLVLLFIACRIAYGVVGTP